MKALRLGLLLLLAASLAACSSSRWFVVRHAERKDKTDDSPLSEPGERRAEALAALLAGEGIDRVFVSDRRRTQQTAAPTAGAFGLEPVEVPAADTNGLIARLKELSGEDVLVVRHSNEVHRIVNALDPGAGVTQVPETEFDNLFVVTRDVFLWSVSVRTDRRKYGAPSPAQ